MGVYIEAGCPPCRDVLERPYTAGGGGLPPPPGPPLPPPSPLPMFETDSQNFASVPRGFALKNLWPAFGGDHRGTRGGGGSQPNPFPSSDPPPPPLLIRPCPPWRPLAGVPAPVVRRLMAPIRTTVEMVTPFGLGPMMRSQRRCRWCWPRGGGGTCASRAPLGVPLQTPSSCS